jgi:mono/diheme cytochrome c family protein
MKTLRNREFARGPGAERGSAWRHAALAIFAAATIGLSFVGASRGADATAASATATFKQYCFQCHGKAAQMAGMSLEMLTGQASVGDSFSHWTRVAEALETHRMPPKGMPQPSEEQRTAVAGWVRAELNAYAKKHDGDPGRVTVRRLTSGEYHYSIQDLTGVDVPNTGIDASSDSVGGEGFTNFGDVQFMQDQNLERYLEAAKRVADHAVIGSGPLEFFDDPGKTGFELSAISRIREIYTKYGFRTVSGEGGRPFGLERYGKAIYANWFFKNRAAMGEPNVTLKELAAREGITAEFAQHVASVVSKPNLGFPSSEVVARFHSLPAPTADRKASAEAGRAAATELQKYLTTWPSWLFARGDVAAGGAGDESPLEFSDRTLSAEPKHRFNFIRGGRGGGAGRFAPPTGPGKVYVNVTSLNPKAAGKPVIIWRNPTVGIRPAGGGPGAGISGSRPRADRLRRQLVRRHSRSPVRSRPYNRRPSRWPVDRSRLRRRQQAAQADGAADCRPDRACRCVR